MTHQGEYSTGYIFDCKGSISMRPIAHSGGKRRYLCRLRLEMVDGEAIYRLASELGHGNVNRGPRRANRQGTYVWETAKQDAVLEILLRLRSRLHIKGSQADVVLYYLRHPEMSEKRQDQAYLTLCGLKRKKPQTSRNQHGTCELWRDNLLRS
jgi:hypothetical protein